jgi:hypothetical protein
MAESFAGKGDIAKERRKTDTTERKNATICYDGR